MLQYLSRPIVLLLGAIGTSLVAFAAVGSFNVSEENIEFLSQEDSLVSTSLASPYSVQQLSCEDLPYDIAEIDLFLSQGRLTSPQALVVVLGRVDGSGRWDQKIRTDLYTSNTVWHTSYSQIEVPFQFDPPVPIDRLCREESDMVYFYLKREEPHSANGRLFGSKDSNAYRDDSYNCVQYLGAPCYGDVKDLYFRIKTPPNHAPVFELTDEQEVTEGEPLGFTVRATDPDGDMLTYSVDTVPEGAAFDQESKTFTWTPNETQAGVYSIQVTVTDDGTPEVLSDELTVFITVNESTTPSQQANELLSLVENTELSTSTKNAYVANVKKVSSFIDEGKMKPARNQIDAFIQKVEMDLEKEEIDMETRTLFLEKSFEILEQLE